ncbi:MAG TPA: LysR family transcriptional regulator [Hyphomicrobiales bacterium]|nr:LysR family transcriptional regulator [Rhodobiaceae bacterium]HXK54075.1 LysR family transcriptional regulator [Hyphomicrobiales bacterium]
MMHSRLLLQFLAAAECGNITAAARALNITQPALTRAIKQLEEIIGTVLFERLPNGVALTRQGEILARRAKLMELEYRHALAEISSLDQGLAGQLRIGAGPVWITTILPPVIAAFHGQYPLVKVRLTSGVISTLVPALLGGELDLVCSTIDFPSQPEFVTEPLIKIRHVVVAREGHPIFARGVARARDLSKYPWLVLVNDHVGTSRIGSYFAANGLEPPVIAVETNSIGMCKILTQGDFLAHFPVQMLGDVERYGLRKISHEGTFWEAEAGITYRLTTRPVRALESFKAILRSSIES